MLFMSHKYSFTLCTYHLFNYWLINLVWDWSWFNWFICCFNCTLFSHYCHYLLMYCLSLNVWVHHFSSSFLFYFSDFANVSVTFSTMPNYFSNFVKFCIFTLICLHPCSLFSNAVFECWNVQTNTQTGRLLDWQTGRYKGR